MQKTILITGSLGQLGRELTALLADDSRYSVIATDVGELDITSAEAVNRMFDDNHIDFIVNCAAYTAVDRAETDTGLCRLLNTEAPAILARAAAAHGAKMIHISTDYVFDGKAYTPYTEQSPTCPATVYGATKREGELKIQELAPESVILRTAWLYSPHGKNFVKTMLALADSGKQLKVVVDQVGTPTSATSLAEAIAAIIGHEQWHPGIYHFSNEGAISWYDFACAIFRLAGKNPDVVPCSSDQYPTPAARPHYSVLDKSLIASTYGIQPAYWHDALVPVVNALIRK